MTQGPWDSSDSKETDPAKKPPPDISGFILFIIGMVLLGVAGWSLLNWTTPEVKLSSGPFSVSHFLHDNPLIYLALIGLFLVAAQFLKKK